jgi:two-component system, NtrC family, nitrogen regulation sensor histidine kinase NtrY
VKFQRRIVAIALLALAPMAIAALVLVFAGDFSTKVLWTVLFFLAVSIFIATYVLDDAVVHPVRTLSGLIAALREEDYAIRARTPDREDAIGEALAEVNALAALMESRKLEAVEAAALLRAVLAQIDAAIFAFDADDQLRLINPAGERLLGIPRERLLGRTSSDIGVEQLLASASGRWDVHESTFRENGVPHRLLVVVDITRALREEEAEAWRRIVRVLGHELNNSLAPIKSIATSLGELVARDPLPDDWRDDLGRGMRVVAARTEALTRFTRAYAQLARLPEPRKRDVRLDQLAERVAALEKRVPVSVGGPRLTIQVDEDQLEQLLINLVKNAADASLETGGAVALRWDARAVIRIEDEGRGVTGTSNLFVPFFTTKPNGSGIGLYLSRQIAEAHGGTLTLENREGGGAVAILRLPV